MLHTPTILARDSIHPNQIGQGKIWLMQSWLMLLLVDGVEMICSLDLVDANIIFSKNKHI